MPKFTDQLKRVIEIKQPLERIISLVPSQTELLYDLGLDEKLIGITKFCVHPEEWFKTKIRIGGTKQLHLNKIRHLRPDLILANKEENVQEQIVELEKDFPVWISDVSNLHDALQLIESIGEITDNKIKANKMTALIKEKFAHLQVVNSKTKTAYLIWSEPIMTVGGDTFINDMLEKAGFLNVFSHCKRYPQITIQELQAADCQLLLLSSEPYPFRQKHADELQSQLPGAKILLVDGELFSWYGSRLLKAPPYFQQLQNQVLSLMHAAGNRQTF